MSQILSEHTVVLFLQIICTFCGVLGAGHVPERVVCMQWCFFAYQLLPFNGLTYSSSPWLLLNLLMFVFAPWMDNLRKKPTFHDNTVVSPRSDIWETSAEIPYWWCATTQIWLLSASDWLEICFIHYCNQIAVSVIMMSQLFQVNRSCNIRRQKWETNLSAVV